MDDSPLSSPASLLLAVLGGNLQFVITSVGPLLGFGLQILSFISLVLIIIVNWRKIFNSNAQKSTVEE
jgi:membrane protein implicated in regulation of membrane protease activity